MCGEVMWERMRNWQRGVMGSGLRDVRVLRWWGRVCVTDREEA